MPNAPRAILAGRPILSTDLRADGNTFTAWRWTLALMVMFSHAWDLTQPRINLDPTVPILTVPISFVAVDLFFTLSGFLVAGSLIKRGLRDYALSRALRILPGLWVMLIVTTLAGLAFTTLPASDYLTDRETLRYLLINGSLAKAVYRLPGVFEQLPIPIVNGSLWTIPHEVRCYIVLALLGALGLLLSRRWFTALFALGAIVHCLVPLNAVEALDYPRRLGFAFFAGVLFYLWRQRVRLSWPVAAGGAVAAVLLAHSALPAAARQAAMQLAFGYLMFVAAFRAPPRLKAASVRLPDYSFGIYIYAFPVQQMVIALGIGVTPLANLVASAVLTIPLAALSWHFVESRALALKASLVRPRGPVAVAVDGRLVAAPPR